jgi:probable selenium-dependent hydroxylase accessory protein YqeC
MRTLYQSLGLKSGGVVSLVGAGGKTSLMFSLAHEISRIGESVLTTTTTKIMMPTRAQSGHVILTTSIRSLVDNAGELLKENRHISAASPRVPEQQGKITGFPAPFIDEVNQTGLFDWIIVEADGAAQKPLKVPAEHEPVIPGSSSWVVGVVGLMSIGQPLGSKWVFRPERFTSITGLLKGEPVTPISVVKAATHPEGIFKGCPPRVPKILFLNMAGNDHRLETGHLLADKMLETGKTHGFDRVIIGSPLETPAVTEVFHIT